MQYKMIISDYDGTLSHAYGHDVAKETVEAIKRYRAAGGYFALCSGRGSLSAYDVMKKNGIECDAICAYQGAVVKIGDEVIENGIAPETVREIVEFVRSKRQRDFVTFNGDTLLYDGDGKPLQYYVQWSDSYKNKKAVDIPEYAKTSNGFYGKLLMTKMPDEDVTDIIEEIKEKFSDKVIINSGAEILVEIVSKDCTKRSACELITKKLGVKESETITVGDSTNDLTLVAFGEGCCVENGVDELKKIAKHIVPSVDEQPVKQIIDKILAGENPF